MVAGDTKFAICSLHLKQVQHEGDNTKSYTTSNIAHLLKSKHPDKYKKYKELKATQEKQNKDKHS